MGAGDLSAALWEERRQLELLLFRLESQRLHAQSGNLQWLRFTAAEVETVLERLRFDALARSVESAVVAAEWGLPAEAPLTLLLRAAPPGPWAEILAEHRAGLQGLLVQLGEVSRAGEDLLEELRVAPSGATKDTAGELAELTRAGNIERALAVTRRTAQRDLADYLGEIPD